MNRGQHVLLWGGPEDGAQLWVPPGELPQLVGAHRTLDGALVPIRGRALHAELEHVAVYEHLTLELLTAWRSVAGVRGRLLDPGGHLHLEDVPLYVYRELATRWLTQGQM